MLTSIFIALAILAIILISKPFLFYEEIHITFCIGIVSLGFAIWYKYYFLADKPFEIMRNSDQPFSLWSYFFFLLGFRFMGKYRQAGDGSYVTYHFFFFLMIPIYLGCYRVKAAEGGVRNWGYGWSFTREFLIYGSDRRKISEIVNVLLLYWGGIITIAPIVLSISMYLI